MISWEKWMILAPLLKLPKNVGDLGKFVVAKGFKKLPKVQKITNSDHTGTRTRFLLDNKRLKRMVTFFPSLLLIEINLAQVNAARNWLGLKSLNVTKWIRIGKAFSLLLFYFQHVNAWCCPFLLHTSNTLNKCASKVNPVNTRN